MTIRLKPSREEERPPRTAHAGNLALDQIRLAVTGIRHGEVRVIIQDGLIIQIDRLEKQRLR